MIRADLIALTSQTLAALTNRGLVKRAARERAAGGGATAVLAPDGTLTGRYPDGTEAALPPGAGLDLGSCACAATGVCRHLVGLVLAYQESAAPPGHGRPGTPAADGAGHRDPVGAPAPDRRQRPRPDGESAPSDTAPGDTAPSDTARSDTAPRDTAVLVPPRPPAPWSPGSVTDEELTAAVGARSVAAARRIRARGYTARLVHPTGAGDEARAELPTSTVRFTVPGALAWALTDSRDERRGEAVALAVWAFRAALAVDAQAPPAEVRVGAAAPSGRNAGEAAEATAELAGRLLLDGAAHAGPALGAALRSLRDELAGHGLHWTADAVGELSGQLDAYASRAAHHHHGRLAALLTELHARHRTGRHGDGGPGRAAMRLARLTSLGCRISGDRTSRTAEVYFGHGDTGLALVLRHRWELPGSTAPGDGRSVGPDGAVLASRRIAGTTLGRLSRSQVVTETAVRTAGHALVLGASRQVAAGCSPLGTSWTELPESLLVRDFAACARRLSDLPPRLIRPRVAADDIRVLAVHAVEDLGYDPAEQSLTAVVRDAYGHPAVLAAPYNPYGPGGLDALAAALGDVTRDGPRHVSAFVTGTASGGLLLDPVAVLTRTGVTVLDLAPPSGHAGPPPAVPAVADPLTAALDDAVDALDETAHRGLRHLDGPGLRRLEDVAAALARTGLGEAAARVGAVAGALARGEPEASVPYWTDAHLFLLTAASLHGAASAGTAASGP
ncbi:hypothetical protein ACFV9Z_06150 [Streptomyces sp. NPDC059883]|uniref:hypothetical protein n=1 Tax=unclassified Streptomyces TaxID=2593676 RepID=UPI0036504F49